MMWVPLYKECGRPVFGEGCQGRSHIRCRHYTRRGVCRLKTTEDVKSQDYPAAVHSNPRLAGYVGSAVEPGLAPACGAGDV